MLGVATGEEDLVWEKFIMLDDVIHENVGVSANIW